MRGLGFIVADAAGFIPPSFPSDPPGGPGPPSWGQPPFAVNAFMRTRPRFRTMLRRALRRVAELEAKLRAAGIDPE